MPNIPGAKLSPRIVNGIIFWYEGDTFELNLAIDIKDQDGEPVEITEDSGFELIIKNSRKEQVYTSKENGVPGITFVCDEETTKLFKKGRYTYDINYYGEYRTSIAEDNEIVVE